MIRELEDRDLDQVCAIERELFGKDAWKRADFEYELHQNPFSRLWAAEEAGRIIGYIGSWKVYDRYEITTLAVVPECRRRGCGSALLEKVLAEAAKGRCDNLTLEVRVSNDPAIRLYEAYGFTIWARKKDYYEDGHEDAYLMGKGTK